MIEVRRRGSACHRAPDGTELVTEDGLSGRGLIRADESESFAEPMRSGPHRSTFSSVRTVLGLARRYWFDALVLAGIGVGIAGIVVGHDRTGGPTGPLWFDVLATVAILSPRRRWASRRS